MPAVVPENFANNEGIDRLAYALAFALYVSIANTGTLFAQVVEEHGDINGSRSDTLRETYYDLGQAVFAAMTSEDQEVTPTAITKTIQDIVVAQYRLAFAVNDLYLMTGDGTPTLDFDTLIGNIRQAWENSKTQVLCDLFPLASDAVGTTGLACNADDFFDGLYELDEEGAIAEFFVHHNLSMASFINSWRGETGALQYRTDIQDLFGTKRDVYIGDVLGVSLYKLGRVTTSGGDRIGAIGQRGSMAALYGKPTKDMALGLKVLQDAQIQIELERQGRRGLNTVIGHGVVGAKIVQQQGIRKVVTL